MKKSVFIAFSGLFWLSTVLMVSGHNLPQKGPFSNQKQLVESHLASFLSIDPHHFLEEAGNIQDNFDSFVQKLQRKKQRYNNDLDFLSHMYYRVHGVYLRHYRASVTMNDLFKTKSYDCLTGTALYALILEALDFDYTIHETSYHIYLTLSVDGQKVLIESTNPLGGFITEPQLIEQLQAHYAQEVREKTAHYQFQETVNHIIDLRQLAGLHYYNLALAHYNHKELKPAMLLMEQALQHYPSNRIHEVMRLMLQTLTQETQIDPYFKQAYLSKYAHIFPGGMAAKDQR